MKQVEGNKNDNNGKLLANYIIKKYAETPLIKRKSWLEMDKE